MASNKNTPHHTHRGDRGYERPWLLREIAGAPYWAMIVVGAMTAVVIVEYVLQH